MTKGAVVFSLRKSVAVSPRKQAAGSGNVVLLRLGGDLQCEVSNLTVFHKPLTKMKNKTGFVYRFYFLLFVTCESQTGKKVRQGERKL